MYVYVNIYIYVHVVILCLPPRTLFLPAQHRLIFTMPPGHLKLRRRMARLRTHLLCPASWLQQQCLWSECGARCPIAGEEQTYLLQEWEARNCMSDGQNRREQLATLEAGSSFWESSSIYLLYGFICFGVSCNNSSMGLSFGGVHHIVKVPNVKTPACAFLPVSYMRFKS